MGNYFKQQKKTELKKKLINNQFICSLNRLNMCHWSIVLHISYLNVSHRCRIWMKYWIRTKYYFVSISSRYLTMLRVGLGSRGGFLVFSNINNNYWNLANSLMINDYKFYDWLDAFLSPFFLCLNYCLFEHWTCLLAKREFFFCILILISR